MEREKTLDNAKTKRNKYIRISIKLGYVLLLTAALSGLILLGYYLSRCCGSPILGGVISAVAMLGVGWGVISILHRVMQSSLYLMIAFVLLFIYGVAVYSIGGISYGEWLSSILSPMNSTLSMFFPSRGGYEAGFNKISLLYTSVHLLAYLYIALLGVSLFGRRVMNRSTYNFIFHRNKNIFWGYSDGGVLLAKDIKDKTCFDKAVFVMPENMPLSSELERYRFDEIDNIGGVVLYRDFSQEMIKLGGARHFFLTEDQDLNVKLAFMVLRTLENQGKRGRVSKLYVRTELALVDRYFTKALENLKGIAEVNTINESELTARRFIKKYPPLEMPNITIDPTTAMVEGDFNFLQLGYGWSGKAILNKLICNTQFEGSTLSAMVFDRDLMSSHGFYPLLDEECFSTDKDAVNYYNVTWECEMTVGSYEFKQWIENKLWTDAAKKSLRYNRIIVALGDDALNVKIALSIARVLNDQGMSYGESSEYIFAHIRNADCCTYFDLKETTPISIFGNKDKIYTMDIIINETLDELAKEMNYSYSGYKGDREALWHSAGVLDQESSRAAAVAVENTLRLRDLQMVPQSEEGAPVEWKLSKDILELLSENEHRRWNAFHFTQGIKCWRVPEDINLSFFKGKKPKPNQIDTLNRHAALVKYGELPDIDAIFYPLIDEYNKKLTYSFLRPYMYYHKLFSRNNCYNKKSEFIYSCSLMEKKTLQESDRRFVRDIQSILERINYKIIELNKTK